jgi:hypothetical protein
MAILSTMGRYVLNLNTGAVLAVLALLGWHHGADLAVLASLGCVSQGRHCETVLVANNVWPFCALCAVMC